MTVFAGRVCADASAPERSQARTRQTATKQPRPRIGLRLGAAAEEAEEVLLKVPYVTDAAEQKRRSIFTGVQLPNEFKI
jgi:hypothetical protein